MNHPCMPGDLLVTVNDPFNVLLNSHCEDIAEGHKNCFHGDTALWFSVLVVLLNSFNKIIFIS